MKKNNRIAIIGASYLQEPLIRCAKDYGLETHVFAWEYGSVGKKIADYFYPISITEKETILNKCREIGIIGVSSIASDLASITVNYIANSMHLNGNNMMCTMKSTNKCIMRQTFEEHNLPSPHSILIDSVSNLDNIELSYPVIVKPTDRSGSRGVCKLDNRKHLKEAVKTALDLSLENRALIEQYIEGAEYSLEYVSFHGQHHFLAATKKYTTGAPHFIECGQFEPAMLRDDLLEEAKHIVENALDALEVTDSASHSEIIIDSSDNIYIVEIGARMGGDMIGSHLVMESTGIDMVRAVLQISMNVDPDLVPVSKKRNAVGIRYVFNDQDINVYKEVLNSCPEIILQAFIPDRVIGNVDNSSNRLGYFLLSSAELNKILNYMPKEIL